MSATLTPRAPSTPPNMSTALVIDQSPEEDKHRLIPDRDMPTEAVPAADTAPEEPPFWEEVHMGDLVEHWVGDKRPATEQHVALVTMVYPGGRCCLTVFVKESKWMVVEDKKSVPHMNDPVETKWTQRYGKWARRRCDVLRDAIQTDTLRRLCAAENVNYELLRRIVEMEEKVGKLVTELS